MKNLLITNYAFQWKNELPARLAFLIPLISQCTVKSLSSFSFCTKTALSERAQLCLPSRVSARECSGTETKRDGEKQGGLQAFQRSHRIWQKKERTDKPNQNPLCASRNKTQEKSSLFSVDANSFNSHTFKLPLRFHRAAPSDTAQLPVGKGPFPASDRNPGATFCARLQDTEMPHSAAWDLPWGQGNGGLPKLL